MILLRYLLGDVLRRHRLQQGRTLREVSAAARISLGYLSEVERGQKEASSELLTSICAALGIRLSDVLSEVAEQLAGFEPAPATPATAETVGDGASLPAAPETTLPAGPEPVAVGAASFSDAASRSASAAPGGSPYAAFTGLAPYNYPSLEPHGLRRGVFADTFPTASRPRS